MHFNHIFAISSLLLLNGVSAAPMEAQLHRRGDTDFNVGITIMGTEKKLGRKPMTMSTQFIAGYYCKNLSEHKHFTAESLTVKSKYDCELYGKRDCVGTPINTVHGPATVTIGKVVSMKCRVPNAS
ncbi:hypothetical protein C8J56DRAFT_590622 [Mycena floridula]|nr:hypothetical protein C8J56DRAFT_590622 [Mycena floridula]